VHVTHADAGGPPSSKLSPGFVRWVASNVAAVAPQSMAPIVFGLATLHLNADINTGAAMIAAMTVAQVVGAVPITAVARRFHADVFLRGIIGFRAAMFCSLGAAVLLEAPIVLLLGLAALAGLANGAIFGLLRATLNALVAPTSLPRALGIAATANEMVFVAGPVAASLIAAWSLALALITMVLTSALPLVTLPRLTARDTSAHDPSGLGRVINAAILVWLACAVSGATAVAAVEVGAVTLAVEHGLDPTWAFVFTVPLCIFSVAGGVWVSVRNRLPSAPMIVLMLTSTAVGAFLIFSGSALWLIIAGTALIGFCLAPLGTLYSLELDRLLPAPRRAEGFALLRSAQAAGMICSGLLLAVVGVKATFATSATLVALAAVGVLMPISRRRSRLR
jgi:hypothetical protein